MSLLTVLLVLLPLGALVALVALGLGLMLDRPSAGRFVEVLPEPARRRVLAVQGHTLRCRRVGVAAAVVVPVLLVATGAGTAPGSPGSLGRGASLLPTLAGTLVLLGVLGGELTVRSSRAGLRTAVLRTRRRRDAVDGRLSGMVLGGGVALAGLLVLAVRLGGPDDLGRAGRSLPAMCPVAAGELGGRSSSTGPWPGSFYAVPLAVTVSLAVLLALAALHVVVRRPCPDAGAADLDDLARRRAGRHVLLGLGVVVLGTLGPVAGVMSVELAGQQCGPSWWPAVALLTGVLAATGLVGAATCVLLLLRPERAAVLTVGL